MQLEHAKSGNKINAFVVIFKGVDGFMLMGTTEYVESVYPNHNYPIFTQWEDGVIRTPAGFLYTLKNSNEVIDLFVRGPKAVKSELYGCITLEVEKPPSDISDNDSIVKWADRVLGEALTLAHRGKGFR